MKQKIIDAKASDDEKYSKNLNEKEVKIQEYERNKVTLLDQIKVDLTVELMIGSDVRVSRASASGVVDSGQTNDFKIAIHSFPA